MADLPNIAHFQRMKTIAAKVPRIRVRALKDGKAGWVTITGNQGMQGAIYSSRVR